MSQKDAQSSIRTFAIVAVAAVILDQLSKTAAARFLFMGESVPVLGDFFRMTLILNPGGVFGTKLGSENFYTIISVLAIGVTLWFFFKARTDATAFRVGLALVLGGAVGNLIDRFRFGKVVDFLDFDFFNINLPPGEIGFISFPGFYLDRWPVFNLADSFVLIGMVLMVLYLFFSKERPKPHSSPEPE